MPTPSVPEKLLDLDLLDRALKVVTLAQLPGNLEQLEKQTAKLCANGFARRGVEPVASSSVAYSLCRRTTSQPPTNCL